MPLVSEALHDFLHARKTPANADLVERWSTAMETQVNVIAADGEPVAGKKSTWSNGSDTWHSIRIPKNAAADPTWEDYKIGYPFDLYAEGIGITGWDWKCRRSRHFGYDFDALTGHAKGIGVSDQDLQRVKDAACALPYVEVRRSTGGGGIHLYVYIDEEGIPAENHTEHAALARCILGMMSAEVRLRLRLADRRLRPRHVDMAPEDDGGEPRPGNRQAGHEAAGGRRPAGQLARPHRSRPRSSHEGPPQRVGRGRHGPVRGPGVEPNDHPLGQQPQGPDRGPEAFRGYTTFWVADHHLLQTHTTALEICWTARRASP